MDFNPVTLLIISASFAIIRWQCLPLTEAFSKAVFHLVSFGLAIDVKNRWRHESLDYLLQQLSDDRFRRKLSALQASFNGILRALDLLSHSFSLRRDYLLQEDDAREDVVVPDYYPRLAYVPVIGQIAAGQPIPVPASDVDDYSFGEGIEIPADIIGSGLGLVFGLGVKGTSMLDALVNDGDVVLFQQVSAADDGDMVAVWLKDRCETTLKKIYFEGPRIRLQPANVLMDPIYTTSDNLEVQARMLYRLGRGF